MAHQKSPQQQAIEQELADLKEQQRSTQKDVRRQIDEQHQMAMKQITPKVDNSKVSVSKIVAEFVTTPAAHNPAPGVKFNSRTVSVAEKAAFFERKAKEAATPKCSTYTTKKALSELRGTGSVANAAATGEIFLAAAERRAAAAGAEAAAADTSGPVKS